MPNPHLTEAQVEALNKAWDLLREHFDHAILAYETEARVGTRRTFDCNYHGGVSAAIGLAEQAKAEWLKDGDDDEP